MKTLTLATILAALMAMPAELVGQIAVIRNPGPRAANSNFKVSDVEINADIKDQVATVQIAQVFQNTSGRTLETQFVFPLPDGAAVTGLTLIVDGEELTGELKSKEEARKVYEEIVRKQRDPALLEYMGRGVFKTSVFPIPAGQNRRVEIRYTQLLKSDSGLIDFSLPLGNARHCKKAIEKLNVTVRVKSSDDLKNIYSPTHDFEIDRPNDRKATCKLTLTNVLASDDIRLLYGTRGSDIGMDLLSYMPEDEGEQGYFLLLASPKVKAKKDAELSKTVLFVVDRSGSMAGQKLEQAKASLRYMINSLGKKDTFNIVSYSSEVDTFRPELELVSAETKKAALDYVDDIYSGGGTNIDSALTTALGQLKDKQRPNYVLFFTDGLPTVGEKSESKIAANASKANEVRARVFSFGVGFDVNSRLLDRLSRDQRGTSVYVKPEEDIEIAATNLFTKVSSPAMTKLSVKFNGAQTSDSGKLVNRMYPQQMPDLFHGEQLVMVGRYKKPSDVSVSLNGNVGGKTRSLKLESSFGNAKDTRRNGFVETLWATRRIGQIIDELDLNGQNKELVDELVALSLRHGIMTPYTSFLAEENTSLDDRGRLLTEARSRTSFGLSITSGADGFAQRDFKSQLQKSNRATPTAESATESLSDVLVSKFGATRINHAPQPAVARAAGGRGLSQLYGNGAASGYGGGGGGSGSFGGGIDPAAPAPSSGARPSNLKMPEAKRASGTWAESEKPRARIKRIGQKTFYWKNNEWQDSVISSLKKKPTEKDIVKVEQFSDEYFAVSKLDDGRWSPYLAVSEPILVRIGDKTYRIVPPAATSGKTE